MRISIIVQTQHGTSLLLVQRASPMSLPYMVKTSRPIVTQPSKRSIEFQYIPHDKYCSLKRPGMSEKFHYIKSSVRQLPLFSKDWKFHCFCKAPAMLVKNFTRKMPCLYWLINSRHFPIISSYTPTRAYHFRQRFIYT